MNESTDRNNDDEPDLSARYVPPASWTDRTFNGVIRWLARRGISIMGSHEIRVVGRTSGQVRTAVINVMTVDGRRYLVAPRGHTQWVRNLRAAGGAGELRVGRRVERFQAQELPDTAKPPIIHAYLDRWGWEVGRFFDTLTKDSSEEEIAAVAPGFPVFALD
jgi:deazaflavin-dependent oxidoreductase (nitroreductase family)